MTLQICVRAEGAQSPLSLIFKGAGKLGDNVRDSRPHHRISTSETDDYDPRCWTFWDNKFRASHQICSDYILKFKTWCRDQKIEGPIAIQLDNLHEQCSEPFRALLQSNSPGPVIIPIYLPGNTTDMASVVDYDLGKLVKGSIRRQFWNEFIGNPTSWSDGGVSASRSGFQLTNIF